MVEVASNAPDQTLREEPPPQQLAEYTLTPFTKISTLSSHELRRIEDPIG
jgi:hypothetical protein